MGTSRSSRATLVCSAFPHPNCSACERTVTRREWHSHSYGSARGDGDSDGTLCGDCYDIVLVASIPVLQVARRIGWETAQELNSAIRAGYIGVLTQTGF